MRRRRNGDAVKIFETENSRYEIDEVEMRYRRTPLGAKQHEHSHRLVYGSWIKMARYAVEPAPDAMMPYRAPENRPMVLRIWAEDSTYGLVTTPIVWMES